LTTDAEAEQAAERAFATDLAGALPRAPSYDSLLREILAQDFAGRADVRRIAELLDDATFFTLANALTYDPMPTSPVIVEVLDSAWAQFEEFYSRFSPIRSLLVAAIEMRLYGIENSWTNLNAQPLYSPEDNEILMRVQLRYGTATVYRSTDRLDDFLRLASTLLFNCQQTLQYVGTKNLELTPKQRQKIREAIDNIVENANTLDQFKQPIAEASET
jgi:hypothetical protein